MAANTVRIATFNVSMEASNYQMDRQQPLVPDALKQRLRHGRHRQIRQIAEILQRVRPDIVLLNEFDYIADRSAGIDAFVANYLTKSQGGALPINYSFRYVAPVNSGEPSPYDIDGDGVASATAGDAYGFGFYPGQYGMAVLSRYPIMTKQVRTFRKLPWHSLPDPQPITHPDGRHFYDRKTWQGLRLSSKSHWDLPIQVGDQVLHLLAAHPTPPVFDGPENRNGARNFDEIRLWADYIAEPAASYLVDDQGQRGGIVGQRFVIVGDYNASEFEGSGRAGAIAQLLHHPKVNASLRPSSDGGAEHSPQHHNGAFHTASWRAQVDYVLPSKFGLQPLAGGVFWPPKSDPLHRLVAGRSSSSDHRLVWMDLQIIYSKPERQTDNPRHEL
ncbi:endonuclease/exonuclease/phosphatase family protein [Ferrimonas senticii]|uniref:endonuclease/exonuclease/phosphatase family protein n=1 Tax=Ferrimonas senticii TaxID=394566 RepID=UPI0006843FED|nr:endonuclease/exonuclease/phosphatase family protein [Ferrimonas senticii]